MLVLSRQRDETIMIGDEIELTVVDIRGDKVRLGIKAPVHVAVHRKEVYEAIRRENEQASAFTENDAALLRSRARPQAAPPGPAPKASRLLNPTPRRESA
ncbi:MAG: carbon storage regulator CsrA [Phycisphaerales bacterium]|nr:carbon storage regulator CsrA [Phycisphaerales bacterium]